MGPGRPNKHADGHTCFGERKMSILESVCTNFTNITHTLVVLPDLLEHVEAQFVATKLEISGRFKSLQVHWRYFFIKWGILPPIKTIMSGRKGWSNTTFFSVETTSSGPCWEGHYFFENTLHRNISKIIEGGSIFRSSVAGNINNNDLVAAESDNDSPYSSYYELWINNFSNCILCNNPLDRPRIFLPTRYHENEVQFARFLLGFFFFDLVLSFKDLPFAEVVVKVASTLCSGILSTISIFLNSSESTSILKASWVNPTSS